MNNLDEQLGFEPLDKSTSVNSSKKEERPVFLMVLCILAFVGNGLGILQGLMMYTLAGFYAKLFAIIPTNVNGRDNELAIFKKVLTGMSWWGIATFIGSVVCLIGALLMWKLKKNGYLLYIIGQLIPILGVLYFFLGAFTGAMTGGAVLFAIILSIFPIAFIIMFGVNQKYLK